MSWVAVAVVGSAVIGAYASSQASKSASDALVQSGMDANQVQLFMYQMGREDMAPWRQAGGRAVNTLEALINAGPGGRPKAPSSNVVPSSPRGMTVSYEPRAEMGQAGGMMTLNTYVGRDGGYIEIPEGSMSPADLGEYTFVSSRQGPIPGTQGQTQGATGTPNALVPGQTSDDLQGWGDWADRYKESPYYDFLLGEGTKALERGAAAKGKQFSGAENKALVGFGQNLASTDYDNWLNRWYQSLTPYQSLAGLGQTSAAQTAQAGITTGQGVAQNTLFAGQGQAAGQLGQVQPYVNTLNWGSNQLANYYMTNQRPSTSNFAEGGGNYGSGWNPNYAGNP